MGMFGDQLVHVASCHKILEARSTRIGDRIEIDLPRLEARI